MINTDLVKWYDGSYSARPKGSLLSDNIGFYGKMQRTGMSYTYLTPLATTGDTEKDKKGAVNKRLIDGYLDDDYLNNFIDVAVLKGDCGSVLFDFKCECIFYEFDLVTKNKDLIIELAFSNDGVVFETSIVEAAHKEPISSLYRCYLQPEKSHRFVKLTVKGNADITLNEVYFWGVLCNDSCDLSEDGYTDLGIANSVSMQSIRGIDRTAFTDLDAFLWSENLRKQGLDKRAVFSILDTYGPLTNTPILPKYGDINKPLKVTLTRNETQCVCLAITNTQFESNYFEVICENSNSSIEIKTSVGGAIKSRWYGVNIGPLFNEEDTICKAQMSKYVTNASDIWDFPMLHLSSYASAVIWVRIKTDLTVKGDYSFKIKAGGSEQIIDIAVLDVTMPDSDRLVHSYTYYTRQHPFNHIDRTEKEINYMNSLGINVHYGLPEENTPQRQAFLTNKRAMFQLTPLEKYTNLVYCHQLKIEDITEEMREEIRGLVDKTVRKCESLGLNYSHWYLEVSDEPLKSNSLLMGEIFKIVKNHNKNIQIYMNPSYWEGFEKGAVSDDATLYENLAPFYNEYVDVSVPLFLNLLDRPEAYSLFSHKRNYNSLYSVNAQHCKNESYMLTSGNRELAWKSIARDFNGWGFYAYFRPEGDNWDDCDDMIWSGLPDYQIVYAGENGPVPTRASECTREGYQDYCLMQLVKEKDVEMYQIITDAYMSGERFEKLRAMALTFLTAQI